MSIPFGQINAANTFQRFIDKFVRRLNFLFAYVDDLLVGCDTAEHYYQHLSQLFQRLRAYHVEINPVKCVFGTTLLEYLGHVIDAE